MSLNFYVQHDDEHNYLSSVKFISENHLKTTTTIIQSNFKS